MDVGSFVQENKRWLLGCATGLVVFFVARGVIGSVYDPGTPRALARKNAQVGSVYDRAALDRAVAEQEALAAEKQRLRQELAYVQNATFQLEGKSMSADEYLGKLGRERKIDLLRGANERFVQCSDKDLVWPATPQGVEEIRSLLFGIEVLDDVCHRLFGAHDTVHELDAQAQGLESLAVRVEPKKQQRTTLKAGKSADVAVREAFDETRVSFRFQSDEAVATTFLEGLRQPNRTLTLAIDAPLKMTQSGRRGDPVVVEGTVVAIAFKEK